MAYDASPSSTHNPATGGTPTAAWGDIINGNFETLGGAWTSFTPTWTGSGGNPAIGNGTLVGGYLQLGKLLIVRYSITMGSTTTFGSGEWKVRLPNSLTVSSSHNQTVAGWLLDSSAGAKYSAVCGIGSVTGDTDDLSIYYDGATSAVTATTPFTWASGDVVSLNGILEVA